MALANGLLSDALLTTTTGGKRLFTTAAAAYERTSAAFRARFGKPLTFGAGWTGYRPLDIQRLLFDQLGYPAAARPGESNHGLGLAGDFSNGVQTYGSAEWKWMNTVGRTHGWVPLNEKNLTFEPWHWLYVLALDRTYGATTPAAPTPPATSPQPEKEDDDMASLVCIIFDVGPSTAPGFASTGIYNETTGFVGTSVGYGDRGAFAAYTAIANALGFKVTEKHVDANGWQLAHILTPPRPAPATVDISAIVTGVAAALGKNLADLTAADIAKRISNG